MAPSRIVKLLPPDFIENGFRYNPNGLNEIEGPFDPMISHKTGGLFCCEMGDMAFWGLYYPTHTSVIVCDVELPEGCNVTFGTINIKTSKMILSNPRSIKEFFKQLPKKERLNAIKESPYLIPAIPKEDRTHEDYVMAASARYGIYAIPEEERTPDLALISVKNRGWMIECIPPKYMTAEVQLAAVTQDPLALEKIPREIQTKEARLRAVWGSWRALQFIPWFERTKEECEIAFAHTKLMKRWIPEEILLELKKPKKHDRKRKRPDWYVPG